jgi:hypothetical protein
VVNLSGPARRLYLFTGINPKAKVNPGRSSNLAIFGQKDD